MRNSVLILPVLCVTHRFCSASGPTAGAQFDLGFCATLQGGPLAQVAFLLSTIRATTLLRAERLDGVNPNLLGQNGIEVLYGYPFYFVPRVGQGPIGGPLGVLANAVVPPLAPRPPQHGLPGFGNAFNGYLWSAAEFDGRVYVGTFDNALTIRQLLDLLVDLLNLPFAPVFNIELGSPGADLVRIGRSHLETQWETVTGFDEPSDYGFRTLAALKCPNADGAEMLIAGSATPVTFGPAAGWKLHCLQKP